MGVRILNYLRVILFWCPVGFCRRSRCGQGTRYHRRAGKFLALALPSRRVRAHLEDVDKQADIDVYVKGANGSPLDGSAVVTLTKLRRRIH